ncbi:MAG: hypothetical protein OXF83_07615 [Anaerolineaceae bacterium]|nr:hypothetical protein [Anaerolineaceae bacterium]
MMEQLLNLLQNPDPVILALAFGILCAIVVILLILVNAVTGFFEIFSGLFDAVASLISSGPEGWCGCLVIFALLLGGGGLLYLLANSCGSGSEINFCRFWPF